MKLIDRVMEELQKQGFLPQKEEFGIAFKYQMTNYVYLKDEDDDNYFRLCLPYIFEVDDENSEDVLEAVNVVNNTMKVVKLVVNDDHVWVCYEAMIPQEAALDEILPYAVVLLHRSRQEFYDQLKQA